MTLYTDEPRRRIITDFALDIKTAIEDTGKKEIIDFRNERKEKVPRVVYRVPTRFLRYRKENGRIASDVYSYEKSKRPLDEQRVEDQKILEDFLRKKDPDQTQNLKASILHQGQDRPAIITADGFLINGNRRRMAHGLLREETHDSRFDWMEVVILPGEGDPGGPPTIKEIEQIENRYQLQSDGKSEYSSFDRALSIRRKIESGMPLIEQIKDDPSYVALNEKELAKVVREYQEKYLEPLEAIDQYLRSLQREGYYSSISSGIGDREGKWQAFLDYSAYVYKKISNPIERIKMGFEEDEIGSVQDAAFKLIRLREFPDNKKIHVVMRELGKQLRNDEFRQELYELGKISDLQKDEIIGPDGKELPYDEQDKIWRQKNKRDILKHYNRARNLFVSADVSDRPLALLEQALKKLEHTSMDPSQISPTECTEAMKLTEMIENTARELRSAFYRQLKDFNKLKEAHKRL